MERVAVVRALRTPIGKYLGGLSPLSVAELGAAVVKPLVDGVRIPIDEVILGCARQAGQGPNPARQVAMRAGIPDTVPAHTVNMACGSGMKSIAMGADLIRLGRANAIVAGGVESMSQVPFLLKKMRLGYRLGHGKLVDGMYEDGFHCRLADQLMGATAETLAEQYGIPRDVQDAFALESQAKAGKAIASGAFKAEIVPVKVNEKTLVYADEHPRPDTTMEQLAKLPPVFKQGGTVHAGNSSGITDGAAATLLVAESFAKQQGLEPLAFLEDYDSAGVDPRIMGIGPVPATNKLLARTNTRLDDYDLVELNEAFAAQVLACLKDLPIDPKRLNVNGGAIALGHPIGCTGARIVVTLLHAMRSRGARRGLATLCVSGGLGLAASFTAP
ncbi:MAG TPA: thiolase family protein [Planctomycetota bacterium]|nr:thiolase family protein [Planctomycetota bacterium]